MNKTKASKDTQTDKLVLTANQRTVFGKQLNKIRKEGLIPANIFGPSFKSQAVSVNLRDFIKTYKTAKETSVIYLGVDKNEIPVLIKQIQKHPVNDHILHIDFRKIDLTQKIETAVPIKIIGLSEAVTQKGGVLLTLAETLMVEALPQSLPQNIEIDISKLKEIGQEFKVSDLIKSDKYIVKESEAKVIVSVVAHKEESITPETTAAAPEVITAKEEVAETGSAVPETAVKPEAQAKETAKTAKEPAKEQKPAGK